MNISRKIDVGLGKFETLIQDGKFREAAKLCNSAIGSGRDLMFWKTQLAYISFLNDEDDEARYITAPVLFTSLIEANPTDANCHFWLGYSTYILFNDKETAKSHIFKAKIIDPKFFYCDLVLAGFSETPRDKRLEYLENVLEQEPNLYSGLIEVSEALIELGQIERAKRRLTTLLNSPPYIEKTYGIMNDYINEVLTGAYYENNLKHKAEMLINSLS